jgi:PleD family two-component response regulator
MKQPKDEARDIISRADQALYQSKENGRNRVTLKE